NGKSPEQQPVTPESESGRKSSSRCNQVVQRGHARQAVHNGMRKVDRVREEADPGQPLRGEHQDTRPLRPESRISAREENEPAEANVQDCEAGRQEQRRITQAIPQGKEERDRNEKQDDWPGARELRKSNGARRLQVAKQHAKAKGVHSEMCPVVQIVP